MSVEPRLGRRLRHLGAACAAALLTVLAWGSPAHSEPSPGEKIAQALEDDPVYVAEGLETAVPPDRQRALADRIEQTGLPIKVVLVPLTNGDPWSGDPDRLASVVRERLGGGELILITPDRYSYDDITAHEWPGDKHQARSAANAVFHQDDMKEAALDARIARAIDLIEDGNGREVFDAATADLADSYGDDRSGSSWSLPVAVGVAVLLAAGVLLVWRVRRGEPVVFARAARSVPFAAPRAVFAAAREADEKALRRRAHEEVVALGEELGDREGATPALGRALDAYAAAGTVLDAARDVPDLAGVLALVAEGRDAARESSAKPARRGIRSPKQTRLPLCFFHPLHGRAARTIAWRPMGRRDTLRVAACETCVKAVREKRAPEVLTDNVDGRDVPYFEVPAEQSLWAATGYGSLGGESLAARVARGDFTRARGERPGRS